MLWCSVVLLALCASVQGRAVNISNTWVLPEEGFPVFYRYFRDRISWYEADAVCQFHHANLVTVDTTAQYDAVRAYLKELDISSAVWVGLIRSNPDGDFTWTDYRGLSGDGYWSSAPDARTAPLCAAADPAADYRWEARPCGGPTVASFICELPVPQWALGNEGCMVRALPALTILYLPESAAVQLTADCGLAGVKRVQCTGNVKREDLLKELSCTDENESSTPSVSFTGTSWPLTSDTAFTDQDITNDVTTEENITTEREDNINQSNVIIQSTPIPYKFNSDVEYKLPINDKIKLNKIYLEKNLLLEDIHNNNLQSNDIPKIANDENYITSEQLDKMEDDKNMQHKMLHEAIARIGNIENIFTQPTDHFVPPLVMAKAKMSEDMTVLSLKEKHAQQIAEQRLSQHNSQHEHMHIDKSTMNETNSITDVPLVMPVTTSKFNDYEKKDKIKSFLPKKYNEKYYDPKNKVLKMLDNKSIKTEKSTEMSSTQSASTVKNIETTTVKILQQETIEDDPLIDLTVIIKDNPTSIKNKTIITNYSGDVPKLETILNDTTEIADNLTEASSLNSSFKNMNGNVSNFTLNNEIIKITIISDNNSTVHPTILEITTKIPVFTDSTTDGNKINLFSNTTQEKSDNITVTKKPAAESASQSNTGLERNDTITTPIPITSTDGISTSTTDIKTTITIHTTSAIDKKTTEIPSASTTTTQSLISNNDKENTSESALSMNIPDSTINILNIESQDEFDHNSTDSSGIDDFQSPLLSAASEPLHRPNRSRRPQQPQNRIKFNPFRLLG